MVYYYKMINFQNSDDNENEITSITSTEAEKKRIDSIIILKEVNTGTLRGYIEQQNELEYPTGEASIQNEQKIVVDYELKIGETLKLTLQNAIAGTNAEIYGMIKYEIK